MNSAKYYLLQSESKFRNPKNPSFYLINVRRLPRRARFVFTALIVNPTQQKKARCARGRVISSQCAASRLNLPVNFCGCVKSAVPLVRPLPAMRFRGECATCARLKSHAAHSLLGVSDSPRERFRWKYIWYMCVSPVRRGNQQLSFDPMPCWI